MDNDDLLNDVTHSRSADSISSQTELLNDLMIDLHIEVGRTKVKISQLLTMAQGDVIQLDQSSNDPLIIYANDKPIAKGQIVSSNGKYSIRIL